MSWKEEISNSVIAGALGMGAVAILATIAAGDAGWIVEPDKASLTIIICVAVTFMGAAFGGMIHKVLE